MKNRKQIHKMINKMDNSPLNQYPGTAIVHQGAKQMLEWVLDENPTEKQIKHKITMLEQVHGKVERKKNSISLLVSYSYNLRKGKIQGLQWLLNNG